MTFSGGSVQFESVKFFINPTFEKLFSRKQSTIDAIAEDMGKRGFNKAHPLILADWPEAKEPCLLDGHTRALAALKAGVEPTFVPVMVFDSEAEALDYAIYLQKERRNLTDAELASCLTVLDNMRTRGGDVKSVDYKKSKASHEANDLSKGKSAKVTAEKLGISTRKVERARAVLADKTPIELKEAVKSGEKSINSAYNEIRGAKKPTANDDDIMVSVPLNSPYQLTQIIWESYSQQQIAAIIDMLKRRMPKRASDNDPVPRVLLQIGDPRRDNAGVFHLRATWNSVVGTLNMWEKVTAQIKDEKIWERYPPDNPYGSYDNLLKQEIGYTLAESMSEFKQCRDAQIQAD